MGIDLGGFRLPFRPEECVPRPVTFFWWKVWLVDGTDIEQYTLKGDEHTIKSLGSDVPLVKAAWLPFSLSRAQKAWERKVVAVPTVSKPEEERPAVELASPDGRMVLPSSVCELTYFFDGRLPVHRMVEYHLEHPTKHLVLFVNGMVRELDKGRYIEPGKPLLLGKSLLDDEFTLKKRS